MQSFLKEETIELSSMTWHKLKITYIYKIVQHAYNVDIFSKMIWYVWNSKNLKNRGISGNIFYWSVKVYSLAILAMSFCCSQTALEDSYQHWFLSILLAFQKRWSDPAINSVT